MTTYFGHVDEAELDAALAVWEKMDALPNSDWPGWAHNGFDALFRVRAIVRAGGGGPRMLKLVEALGMVDETPERHELLSPQTFHEFTFKMMSAYMMTQLLCLAGIDPASL